MKKLVCILLGLASLNAIARTADIEVSYIAHSISLKDGKTDVENRFVLLTNATESKFYSPRTEYLDSLNSSPEGKTRYQEMVKNAYFGGKLDQIPRKDGTYYVIKSLNDKKLSYYDTAGLDKFFYQENQPEWQWTIGENTKEILGYECIEATTDLNGRKWNVWFAPEIPIPNGPWKLDGLPGLILEAVADGGQYSFQATGIQAANKTVGTVYLADEYEKTTRKEFLKAKRAFTDNPLGKLKAQTGLVKVVKAAGSESDGKDVFVESSVIDFIETDYH